FLSFEVGNARDRRRSSPSVLTPANWIGGEHSDAYTSWVKFIMARVELPLLNYLTPPPNISLFLPCITNPCHMA
ncbi:hypothetical protein LINPERPRIM_LOCUS15776, partial [Linum perenne]